MFGYQLEYINYACIFALLQLTFVTEYGFVLYLILYSRVVLEFFSSSIGALTEPVNASPFVNRGGHKVVYFQSYIKTRTNVIRNSIALVVNSVKIMPNSFEYTVQYQLQ